MKNSKTSTESPKNFNEKNKNNSEQQLCSKIYLGTNQSYGYEKREGNVSLILENSNQIFHYENNFNEFSGQSNENNREFNFDYIMEKRTQKKEIFQIAIQKLVENSINLSTENTLLFYEKGSTNKIMALVGQDDNCLLQEILNSFFALKDKENLFYIKCSLTFAFIQEDAIIDCFYIKQDQENDNLEESDSDAHNQLKEIYVKSQNDISNVIEFVNVAIKQYVNKAHLTISLYFEKEITKYGKIVHKPKGRLNLICLQGSSDIDLGKFLNPEKSELETISKENYVEKCILHFLSSNFNTKQMPYEDIVFARFLAPMIEKSDKKDFYFQLDLKQGNINSSLNDLLFAELCRDVSANNEGSENSENVDEQCDQDKIFVNTNADTITNLNKLDNYKQEQEKKKLQQQLDRMEKKRQKIKKELGQPSDSETNTIYNNNSNNYETFFQQNIEQIQLFSNRLQVLVKVISLINKFEINYQGNQQINKSYV